MARIQSTHVQYCKVAKEHLPIAEKKDKKRN
jgi:hypothetical protein